MCQVCGGCQECGFRGATLSLKGNKELQVVEDSNWFDKKLDKWRVKDAFQLAPRVLRSNYRRVLRMSETTERRLDKIGKKNEASELFNKMIKIGAFEDIGAAELDMWKEAVHYLPSQAVIRNSSVNSPLRLVTNSSLVDPGGGYGPDFLTALAPNMKLTVEVGGVHVTLRPY